MLRNHDGKSINSQVGSINGGHINELEDTVASSRSSFEDLWGSASVEIRDSAYARGELNATTSLLMTCKSQVIYPYFYVAWRPFHIQSFRYQGCTVRKVLNIFYTLFIFLLIIFGYTSSIIACQARLDVKHKTTTPRTLKPTIRVTTTLMPQTTTRVNKTTGRPTTTNSSLTEVTSSNRASSSTWSTSSGLISVSSTVTPGKYRKVISWYTIATQNVIWKPAVIECTHIFSTYVVTNVFHFLAFFTGFYMFRIQESFLAVFSPQKNCVKIKIIPVGWSGDGLSWTREFPSVLFCLLFGLSYWAKWSMASLMAISYTVEFCVSAVIIVNYCAQCELLVFYLREISLEIEEKTKRVCNLVVYFNDIHSKKQLLYRIIAPILDLIFVAARLTSVAKKFKQKCLHVRVFGYPSASQLDLDSFVLFSHSAEMKAKLLFMPVHGSYLASVIALFVFVILLLLQTNIIAGNDRYL
ncbi:hypothetical protein P5673_009109 [Acropora cervicornis]|uniref:Uncharacterized protein n=1 Tax=Acropora cervicornis TaxID=6130 RepID=A0AAD9QSD1_ACRCE|nr:hypothetical protein P5673_009109 [Acropora cervicornis]